METMLNALLIGIRSVTWNMSWRANAGKAPQARLAFVLTCLEVRSRIELLITRAIDAIGRSPPKTHGKQ